MNSEVILFSSRQELEKGFIGTRIITFQYEGDRFCLTQVDDKLIVFNGICPHLGYSLQKAPINPLFEVVCPWHNFKFSLYSGIESEGRCKSLYVTQAYWNDQNQLAFNLKKD